MLCFIRRIFQNPYLVIGGLTLFGAVIRLYNLGTKSLWFDEAVVFWVSQGNFLEVIAQNASTNSSPIMFPLILNVISRLNDSEIFLRALPLLSGLAAIPAIYFLARLMLPRHGAYFSALLVTFASSQVRYSQELREYSLAFLFAVLMLAVFYKYIHEYNWGNLVLLALFWSLGMLVQYGLALLVLSLNIVLLFEWIFSKKREVDSAVKWVVLQFTLLLVIVLVYQTSLNEQMNFGIGAAPFSHYLQDGYWDGTFHSLVNLSTKNTLDVIHFAYPMVYIILFTCLLGVFTRLNKRHGITLAMLFLPLLIAFLAAVLRVYPYLGERQLIYLVPMILIFAGAGFDYIWDIDSKKLVALCLVFTVVIGGLFATSEYLQQPGGENIKPIINTLSKKIKKGDRIYIYYGAYPAFTYYYREHRENWILGVGSRDQNAHYFKQLDEELSEPGRIWLVFSHCWHDECQLIPTYVSEKRELELREKAQGALLYLAK
jgi:uncharacterized membrane protein